MVSGSQQTQLPGDGVFFLDNVFCLGRRFCTNRLVLVLQLSFFVLIGAMLGCAEPTDKTPPAKTPSANTSSANTPSAGGQSSDSSSAVDSQQAKQLLRKVREAYAKATSYTDNTALVFYGVPRATGSAQEFPFTRSSVAFERPGLLHLTYKKYLSSPAEESYEVVSDGLTIRSSALDELPDQIHEAVAPVRLTVDNFVPEPALRKELMQGDLVNSLPQLAMLLAEDLAAPLFTNEQRLRQLKNAELDGVSFHRLELSSPAGKRVLWIDPKQFTLRRMEIPIAAQHKELNPRNEYSDIGVWIDFENVIINSQINSEVFTLTVPEGARRVRRFIPPPPAGPPEHFGKPIEQFSFTSLEGDPITPETLKGKVVLFDFWTTICPPCRGQTPVLNKVYQHFAENDEFEFLAVSLDNRAVSNEKVSNTLVDWGGEMTAVRDRETTSVSKLNVRNTPSLIAIDREGRLQSFQVGAHRDPQPLIDMIQRMLDGENLIATERVKHSEFVDKYHAALEAAEIKDSVIEVAVVLPDVPKRKLPEEIKLTELWQSTEQDIALPGALLAAGERVLALDDGLAIVEFDLGGKLVNRHELPDHPERKGGFLRSWTNEQGDTWTLASGAGWQKVYVHDKAWELALSFPDENHSGIGDVLFDDLTGSDTPVIYVGYWGGLGIQGGTLDGRRVWSNRRLDHVLQLGVGNSDVTETKDNFSGRSLLATSTRGTLTQLGPDGKLLRERYIPGQALMYFASQPEQESHCGLSVRGAGEYIAVGFNNSDELLWEYALPSGEYTQPTNRILPLDMSDGSPGWLIVAANGTLHWLDFNGELIDRFDVGAIVTGIAVQRVGEQTRLLVATAEGVTAWQVHY